VVVVPLALFTVWLSTLDVLVVNELLPLKTAVIGSVPTANFVVV
jgi:hypothetical protein